MQKPQFAQDQIYHIFNRGVEKRDIFVGEKDYFRFVHDLYEFNDEDRVYNSLYFFKREPKSIEVQPQYVKKERKLLVDILAFVLMPNHFHLILRQRVENGIVKFLQKIGTGYTMYFNKKYERVGSLFQGRF
ncbi:MAG: transposase, partial [Patescibacteria group bacterium]